MRNNSGLFFLFFSPPPLSSLFPPPSPPPPLPSLGRLPFICRSNRTQAKRLSCSLQVQTEDGGTRPRCANSTQIKYPVSPLSCLLCAAAIIFRKGPAVGRRRRLGDGRLEGRRLGKGRRLLGRRCGGRRCVCGEGDGAVVEGHVEPVHGCERGRPGSVGWGRAAAGVRVGAGSSRHGRRRCQKRRRRRRRRVRGELELELIQSQMAQKPMLRGEVGARAWRVLKRMGKRSRLPRSLRARGKLALVPLSMPSTSLPYRSRLTWDLHTHTHITNIDGRS